ncbi:MAG: restriction endonuclease, partial [Symploca sp. SIO2G7]|nr:restriction endonuclease [Symploca sp. SIO2G7]
GDLKRLLREELNKCEPFVEDRGKSKSEFAENIWNVRAKAKKIIKILGSLIEVSISGLVKKISTHTVEQIVKEIENLIKVPIESLEDIEQQLDAVDQMTGREFEEFLAKLFKQLGYQVVLTQASADYGADLVIQKESIKAVVQAKRKQGSVGIDAVQQVVAAIAYYQANLGMVITNSKFTENAKNLAVSNQIELWDREDLKNVFKKVCM